MPVVLSVAKLETWGGSCIWSVAPSSIIQYLLFPLHDAFSGIIVAP